MLATLGIMAARKPEVHQRVEVGVGNGKDMTSTTTVTPVGTAKLFVLFMPELDAAGPTISSRDVDIGFVNKLHDFRLYKRKTPRDAQGL